MLLPSDDGSVEPYGLQTKEAAHASLAQDKAFKEYVSLIWI